MPDKFPEPVSGQPIPRSWFARLVRYINSLRPRGDGRYITVSRTPDGATIKPTPALLQLVSGGGAPSEPSPGATGLISSVSGGTASISVSGSSPLIIKPGSNMTLEDDSGALKLNASGIGGMPNYSKARPEFIYVTKNSPYINSGFLTDVWIIGNVGIGTNYNMNGNVQLFIGYADIFLFDLDIADGSALRGLFIPVFIPVPANIFVQITASGNATANLHIYPTL